MSALLFQPTEAQKGLTGLLDSPNPYILGIGAMGSGKSVSAIAGFLLYSLQFTGKQFGIVGKTSLQTRKVIEAELSRLCEFWGIPYSRVGKEANVGRNEFIFYDGATVQAAERIQGGNLAGLYIDEVYNISQRVMEELENRVRVAQDGIMPKIVMTANPRLYSSWLKRDYVDRAAEIGLEVHKLLWGDNPTLPKRVKERVLATSSEAQRKHRIEGEWGVSTLAVYPHHHIGNAPDMAMSQGWYLAVDPAQSGTTHALLIGRFADCYWVYDEWVWDGQRKGAMEQGAQVQAIKRWLTEYRLANRLSFAVYDTASANYKTLLEKYFTCPIKKADKSAEGFQKGISLLQALLEEGHIKVNETCTHLQRELASYQYADLPAERAESKPKKQYDHGLDALRYWAWLSRPEELDGDIGYASPPVENPFEEAFHHV